MPERANFSCKDCLSTVSEGKAALSFHDNQKEESKIPALKEKVDELKAIGSVDSVIKVAQLLRKFMLDNITNTPTNQQSSKNLMDTNDSLWLSEQPPQLQAFFHFFLI